MIEGMEKEVSFSKKVARLARISDDTVPVGKYWGKCVGVCGKKGSL